MALKHFISFATFLAANFGCYRFRIIPDIVSKLLRAAMWSRCDVWFGFEQTPFPRTGRWLRPAALHRIRFGTFGFDPMSCFVPMLYFYSETNEWSQDWAKRWELLCSATTSSWFHRKKKWFVAARYLQSIKTLLTVKQSQYRKSDGTFSSSEPVAARSDCRRLGNALCLCSPTWPTHAVPERCPKSLAVDFAAKSIDCLLE